MPTGGWIIGEILRFSEWTPYMVAATKCRVIEEWCRRAKREEYCSSEKPYEGPPLDSSLEKAMPV